MSEKPQEQNNEELRIVSISVTAAVTLAASSTQRKWSNSLKVYRMLSGRPTPFMPVRIQGSVLIKDDIKKIQPEPCGCIRMFRPNARTDLPGSRC